MSKLTTDKAIELIEFIGHTNYELAPFGDGIFDTSDEAMRFVKSDKYSPEEPLDVCFDTKQGNYWESAQMTFENEQWHVNDLAMGGLSASGEDIASALINFRNKHDASSEYHPVELIQNAGKTADT